MSKPDGTKKKDKKQPKQAAPITTSPAHKLARTQANKQRRMARDAKLKAKHHDGQVCSLDQAQQANLNMFYLAQRLRAQHVKQRVVKQVQRVEHVKVAKTMYSLEARAHVQNPAA